MAFDRKLPGCRLCPYYKHEFVPPEGSLHADILFVADSPWKTEVARQRPLIGPSGDVFNALLEEYGFDRKKIFITNAVHCCPSALGQSHPQGVTELCTKLFLHKEIERVNPKLVVPMGGEALKAVGDRTGITKARGLVKEIEFFDKKLKILPTFHPSYILRNPSYLNYASADYAAMRYFLRHGRMQPQNKDLDYRSVTTTNEVKDFFASIAQSKYIACDLETTGLDPYTSTILTFGFSTRPKTGFVIPMYVLPYKTKEHEGKELHTTFNTAVLKRLLNLLQDSSKIFLFHNGKFDLRMMYHFFQRHLGQTFRPDAVRWLDTMAMYGLLEENTWQSLKEISKIHTDLRYTEEELKNVKDGGLTKASLEKLTIYNSRDVDATLRIGLKFIKELKQEGLWDIFVRHVGSDMLVARTLFKMEIFGAPIDAREMGSMGKLVDTRLKHFLSLMALRVGFHFNPRSVPQLRKALFEVLKFSPPEKRTQKGAISTDKQVVDTLIEQNPDSRFLKYLRLYRNYDAINKTFIRGFEN